MSDVVQEPHDELGDKNYNKEKVVKIIGSMVDKISANKNSSMNSIVMEVHDLAKVIEDMRAEIGSAGGGNITGATDELDAIIEGTKEATDGIMSSCEIIQDKAAEIGGEHADVIMAEAMKIFEACSFQDITGQRVNKVMTTFRMIEEKIERLVDVLGIKRGKYVQEDTREGDEALLNGPQLEGEGISQEDIDKLLAEFD